MGFSKTGGKKMETRKKKKEPILWPYLWIILTVCLVGLSSSLVFAATNQGTGDIGGDSSDLTDSNVFNLSTTTLALVKKAFLASDGSAISDGASLPRGTLVKFMIYINNTTAFAVNDVSARDVLNAAFFYQAGTLKVDSSVANCAAASCTTGEEATIFTAVDGVAASTDAVDGDVVSIAGATIDAGNQNVANGPVNIPANRVWAVLLTVEMQ